MFDIGTGELLAIAVIALLVLGPDKLPKYAADAARFLRQIRTMANDAKSEVRRELGPELEGMNLSLNQLNPRSIVRKQLLDGVDGDSRPRGSSAAAPSASAGASPNGSAASPSTPAATPYDPDAT